MNDKIDQTKIDDAKIEPQETAAPASPPGAQLSCEPRMGPFYKAFASAQAEFKPIKRTKEVKVAGKDGRPGYSFWYAPLEEVLDACLPALNKYGIVFTQDLVSKGGRRYLITALHHESGASKSSVLELPAAVRPQEIGSALTFMKRYAASAAFGVNSEDDDDANTAEGNDFQYGQRKSQPWARKQ